MAVTRLRRQVLLLGCCAVMGLAPATVGFAQTSRAQDRNGGEGRASALGAATIIGTVPRLEVPSVIIGSPASETSLGIAIGRDGELPANTYVRIRGVNPMMALTSGHVIAPGAWAVPIAALPDLRVVIPAGASGKTEVHVALVAIDGGVVAEARTTLVVAAAAFDALKSTKPPRAAPAPSAAAPPTASPTPAPPPPPAPAPSVAALPPTPPPAAAPPPAASQGPTAPPLSAAARERAEGFLARGRALLAQGNIASARLFFRRAAESGLADGALAMGDTFDPLELSRLNAIGIHPDAAEARHWYEKARELGAGSTADRRLERLGGR
ncbi:MAG: hypothetical protein AB7L90_07115 [Hyphomicrobiaceae bacterium]